ncbi:MAG TPA: hypothetical protein VL854_03205 [Nitrososphaeraceae archaeon]|nr:hypothetical protein [Nitrososphaeraceae archaeon]
MNKHIRQKGHSKSSLEKMNVFWKKQHKKRCLALHTMDKKEWLDYSDQLEHEAIEKYNEIFGYNIDADKVVEYMRDHRDRNL